MHAVFIVLLLIQLLNGSRFFLPAWMRVKRYDKMLRKIGSESQDISLCCQIWTTVILFVILPL